MIVTCVYSVCREKLAALEKEEEERMRKEEVQRCCDNFTLALASALRKQLYLLQTAGARSVARKRESCSRVVQEAARKGGTGTEGQGGERGTSISDTGEREVHVCAFWRVDMYL